MPDVFARFEAALERDKAAVLSHLPHLPAGHHYEADTTPLNPTTQENPMPSITAAKNALDEAAKNLIGIAGNPVAEAIAEAALGTTFGPAEINVVLNVIRAIEHGPGAHQQTETTASTETNEATPAIDPAQHTTGAAPATATFTANPQQPSSPLDVRIPGA